MDTIIVEYQHGETVGTYFGPIASQYAYRPEFRARVEELAQAAQRSSNRHFVLDGLVTRAAQSTMQGALNYMQPGYVLVSIKGCGVATHVSGTNGGTMPCGANLTRFGVTEPYYCARCS